jgi:ABC-type nitrate/sulfonate/bicarbonate transport system substrate-binding protein
MKILTDALHQGSLTEDDVEWVNVPVGERFIADDAEDGVAGLWSAHHRYSFDAECFRALLRGEVDVVASRPPLAALYVDMFGARVLGDVSVSGCSSNIFPIVLTVSEEFAQRRPDLVRLYVAALRQASVWASERLADAKRIMARALSVPEVEISRFFSDDFPRDLDPSITPDAIEKLEEQKGWLLRHGFLEKDYDLSQFVDGQFA